MDVFLRRHIGHVPVGKLLTSLFFLLLLLSVSTAAWLLISSGNRIVSKVVLEGANSTSRQATLEIARFLRTPAVIGQSVKNAILAEYIDIAERDSITRFFYELPQRDADYGVSGIYLADHRGIFSGVDSELINRTNNWSVLHSPAGRLNKYQLNFDGTAGRLLDTGLPYDATGRPWYTKAIATNSSVWTTIYEDANSGQPVITWAQAIRDDNARLIAVVGVDLLLSRIQQFLEQLPISDNTAVFLTDGEGALISGNFPFARESTPENQTLHPQQVLDYLSQQHDGIQSIKEDFESQVTINGSRGLLKIMPVAESVELAWRIGVFVPVSDYLSSLGDQLMRIVPLGVLILFIVWFALQLFLRLTVKPLYRLINSANEIADGRFNTVVDTSYSNEVGELASAIESMRSRLKCAFEDITEQKIRAETTLGSIADGVITIGHEGTIEYMNRAAETSLGKRCADAIGLPLEQVMHARDDRSDEPLDSETVKSTIASGRGYECNLMMRCTVGNECIVECKISPLVGKAESAAHGAVLVFNDVTEQLELREELIRQATTDDLTGLMNRRQFDAYLSRIVDANTGSDSTHCLCYMDLDQFKVVNDTCGHIAGDELLRQIAQLLRDQVRQGDVVARLGGDEFALLLTHCTVEQASRVTGKLLEAINAYRFIWQERIFSVGISIGIAAIDDSTLDSNVALADADNACYAAKTGGRNRIHVHRPDDEELVHRHEELQMVSTIDYALNNDLFVLHTQEIRPINGVANRGGHFEVLVRMLDSNGDILPPELFLPTAERYNQASKIDRWVVQATLRFFENQPQATHNIDQCSINLSGQSIGDVQFLPWLLELIDSTTIASEKLCFEVTETSAIANLNNAIALMRELRQRGCKLALDDFGSGFSSLAYLKTLPFDYLKIDGLFVREVIDDPQDLAMVRLINEIGQTMGMKTIAEYVESDQLRDQLASLGVDYVQGYAIDKPQSIDRLADDSDDVQLRVAS